MHAVEVDSYFDYVAFADLGDGLDQWSLLDSVELIGGVGVVLLTICILLRLVSMDPHKSLLIFLQNIQLVCCHVLLSSQIDLMLASGKGFTWTDDHWCLLLQVQLVSEVSSETFAAMSRVAQHFADEHSVKTDALLASCVND